MNGFLAEAAKKAADRWLELLVLPGALWVATLAVGLRLGHAHALDFSMLRSWISDEARQPASRSTGYVVFTAAAFLLLAAAAGLTASALGVAAQRFRLLPPWRIAARVMTAMRVGRWLTADEKYRTAIASAARLDGPARAAADRRVLALSDRRIRIGGRVQPTGPTWIADRFRNAADAIQTDFGLEIDRVWPRLWPVLSDTLRTEIGTAQDAYIGAARLTGWGLLYLVLAAVWWPAAAVSVVILTAAAIRGRSTATVLVDLICAGVELHVGDLAERLGIEAGTPFGPEDGKAVMAMLTGARQSRD